MYMFLQDFVYLEQNFLDSHSYNIWLGLFLNQILLFLVVVFGLESFHPPFVKGIIVVVDIDFVGIAVEGTVVVDIVVVDIEQDDTEDTLIQLAYAHNFHQVGIHHIFL